MDQEYIIRIILRARDEMSTTLKRAQQQLETFGKGSGLGNLDNDLKKARQEAANLEQQTKKNTQETEKHTKAVRQQSDAFRQANAETKRYWGELNKVRNTHKQLRDDFRQGKITATQFASDLKRLSSESERASKSFEVGSERARRLSAASRVVAKDIGKTADELRGLNRQTTLGSRFLRSFDGEWGKIQRSMNRAFNEMSNGNLRLKDLTSSVGLMIAQPIVSFLVALSGGLIAVAGSAEQAAFAIGGALVSGLAQLAPVIGIAILSMQRLSSIFDVIKQKQLLQQQQSSQTVQAHRKESSATDTLKNAYDSLASAHKGVADAQRGLTNARRDAARQLQDLILQEKSAQLAARGAVLSQRDAQAALQQAVASGAVGDIAQRQLDVQQSALGVTQTRTDATRARQDARRLVPRGVEGQDNVVAAKEQVASAARSLDQARRGIEAAKRGTDQAGQTALAAAGKLQFLEKQLSSTERQAYKTFSAIYNLYNDPKGPIRGITDIVISSFNNFGQRLLGALHDRRFIQSFTNLAHSIAGNVNRITADIFSPRIMAQFRTLTAEAAKNLTPITSTLISLAHSFLNIAVAARPLLRHIIDLILQWAKHFESITNNTKKMNDFFANTKKHLDGWVGLLKSAFGLMQALLSAGSSTGLRIVKGLTDAMNRATEWIQKHPKQVKQFFDDTFTVLKAWGQLVLALGGSILKMFSTSAGKNFADVLRQVLIPALDDTITIIGWLSRAFLELLKIPFISDMAKWGVALLILNKALFGLPAILARAVASMIVTLLGFESVTEAVALAWTALQLAVGATTAVILGWVAVAAAVVIGLVILEKKFHIFEKLWKLIKEGAAAVIKFLKDHWVDVLIVVLAGPFAPLIILIKHHWSTIKGVFKDAFDGIKSIARSAWRGIGSIFRTAFGGVLKFVSNAGDAIVGIFSDIGSGIASAFKDGLGIAYTIVATFINGAVDAFNTVAGALNAILPGKPIHKTDFHLPATLGDLENRNITRRTEKLANRGQLTSPLGEFEGPHAAGGMLTAKPGGRLIQVAEGGHDEVVLTTDPRHRKRTEALLGQFLKKTKGSFQAGGWVGKLPSQVSLSGVHLGVLQAARDLIDKFPGLVITSATQGNHAANSYHYRGLALDIGGPPHLRDIAGAWAGQHLGPSLTEGIHNPTLSYKFGKKVPPSFWGSTTWAAHRDHIHLAVAGALKLLGGGAFGDPSKLINKRLGPINASRAGMFAPVINYVRARARHGLNQLANRAGGADTVGGGLTPYTGPLNRVFNNPNTTISMAQAVGLARRAGFPDRWAGLFGHIAEAESTLRPGVVNSIGATGLWQIYNHPDLVQQFGNMRNPWNNARAALSLWRQGGLQPWVSSRGAWGQYAFARGGEIPGPGGMPQPILAHAGEWILNRMQQSKLAQAMGMGHDRLKNWMGFTGGKRSYQGGGEVGGPPTSADSLESIANLLGTMRKLSNKEKNFGDKLGQKLTAISTGFDTLSTIMDAEATKTETQLTRLQYVVHKNGLITQRNAIELANLQDAALRSQAALLQNARQLMRREERQIERRIAELRKGGVTKAEKPILQSLVSGRNNVRQRIDDVNQKIAQNIADQYAKQQEVFQDTLDQNQAKHDLIQSAIDFHSRVAQALGNSTTAFQQQTIDNANSQIKDLQDFLSAAKARHDTAAANKIQAQINDLQATIVETTAAMLQSAIDEVNNQAQLAQADADRQNRRAALIAAAGDPVGAARAAAGALVTSGSAMSTQLAALQGLRGTAAAEGNTGVVAQLDAQIEDLKVSIEENTQAQKDSATTIRQAAIDLITSQGQFKVGILGSLQGIVQTIGTISGSIDQTELQSLIQATITTLQGTGAGLAQQLLQGFGIDLTGLHGMDLVKAVQGLDVTQLETGMSAAQKTQFESLITSIIDNEGALQQNTEQLKELSGLLAGPQGFSSTAWQRFRQAIFTGMGGLLPQFQVPALASGAFITRSGLAAVHTGEMVIPARVNRDVEFNKQGDLHINIDHPVEVADPTYLGKRIMWELSHTR